MLSTLLSLVLIVSYVYCWTRFNGERDRFPELRYKIKINYVYYLSNSTVKVIDGGLRTSKCSRFRDIHMYVQLSIPDFIHYVCREI